MHLSNKRDFLLVLKMKDEYLIILFRSSRCRIINSLDSMPYRRFLIAVISFCKMVPVELGMFGGIYDSNRCSHLATTLAQSQVPDSVCTSYFRHTRNPLLYHAQRSVFSDADALSTISLLFGRSL